MSGETDFYHLPVLLEEAVDSLDCRPGGIYVDGTLGGGGHAAEIMKRIMPGGRLVGIDADPEALKEAGARLEPYRSNVIFYKGNFGNIAAILAGLGIGKVDGILLDLGVSSHQLETAGRGFSFARDAQLDMRLDQTAGRTAFDLVNGFSEEELEKIFREYGEERMARRIAAAVARSRKEAPIRTTGELAEIVSGAVPAAARRGKIHPATRVFQALRIAVNNELGNLEKALADGFELLETGGRFAVISFHSLEDRMVKTYFRSWEKGCTCPPDFPFCTCHKQGRAKLIARKAIKAGPAEIEKNPRARSARLRTVMRIR
ncbi:MAG: 16S rRNA (cytosine(1402)-N(4))-methyltransferase RsmH [Syntrophaceae bacterium]